MNNLIAQFEKEHTKMGGQFYQVSEETLVQTLSNILKEEKQVFIHQRIVEDFGLQQLVAGDSSHIRVIGPDTFTTSEEWRNQIKGATASVTNAVALIAFSGTVAISVAMDNSRLLSLSPQRNVVIARENQLVADLEEFLEKFGEEYVKKTSQLVFVSGTSRTADIEKVLIRGVHGPKFFDVILVTSNIG